MAIDTTLYIATGALCVGLFLITVLWRYLSPQSVPIILPAFSLLLSILMIGFTWQLIETQMPYQLRLPVIFIWLLIFVINFITIMLTAFDESRYIRRPAH